MVKRIILTLSTILYALLLTYCSLSNLNNSTQFEFEHMDKLIHYLIYFIFSLLVYNTLKVFNLNEALIITILLTFSFGVIIEICQLILKTYRNFELLDIFSNTLGILTFSLINKFKKTLLKN